VDRRTGSGAGLCAAATASAAAPAAGDSDLPGWQRNPGDRDVSGSSASTTASAAGA